MELAKAYNPKEAEESLYQKWEAAGCFAPEINENPNAVPYSIVIPPPNVTGLTPVRFQTRYDGSTKATAK